MAAAPEPTSIAVVTAIADVATRVGFPVVVAAYLLITMEPRLDRFLDYQAELVNQMATLSNACAPRITRLP